ncbi:DUF4138 domain-containing protein [Hymenobacter guriensis]|uniref:DUF4138 domain-containing protein n=1 Tax=Hymenobacter guriensis TaxID=2793065 RepID=A0ABS0L831_9BACT|nr:DUF4138 domain-containing protein [Hymenobacter guriensis]MBG8556315.1 DUF4138 domain-containing protein [Hymenobacter guriensis]
MKLYILLGLGLLAAPTVHAQRRAQPLPAQLSVYSPSSPAAPAPGPAGMHTGGYTSEGQHFTMQRLAPPPPPTPPGATATALDIAVSDSSTTYLVFPGTVSLVDVGMMDNYLVKIEANSVFIRGRKNASAPTPIMVRHGSKYWIGRLVTVKRPVLTLYDFTKPGALNPPPAPAALTGADLLGSPDAIVGDVQVDLSGDVQSTDGGLQTGTGAVLQETSTGVGPDNELAMDRAASKKARINALLRRLDQYRDEIHSVAIVDNRLSFSLTNVRNDKQFTYMRFKLVNNSSIDYQVDFADFTLVENDKRRFLGKKRNEARRPMMPAGGHPNQRVKGNSTGYIYYAVPLYAATNEGHLAVGLRELSGARAIQLRVPSHVINTAPTFIQ